jgi:hypothetical protein
LKIVRSENCAFLLGEFMARQVCPVCSVCIENGIVKTSLGKPLSKKELKSRVCIYAKYHGCINDFIGEVAPYFKSYETFTRGAFKDYQGLGETLQENPSQD